jgi:SAM-dependent methyltransferase
MARLNSSGIHGTSAKPSYKSIADSFDLIAPSYDANYGQSGNDLMSWMRQENLAMLKATFPQGSQLLEIGCGTGDEALNLAQAGYKVLATDISPVMAAQTAAKARAAGLNGQVTAVAIPGGQLDSLQPKKPFEGAFASFGVLNCEPDLDHLVTALAANLHPGAAFVCSVMARWSLIEITWYLIRGRPRQAFRRLRRGWQPAPIQGGDGQRIHVPVRYFTVGEIERIFAEHFRLEQVRALPLLLPPPYLESIYKKYRTFYDRLEPWEFRLRDRWPWNGFGDHISLVFRRK